MRALARSAHAPGAALRARQRRDRRRRRVPAGGRRRRRRGDRRRGARARGSTSSSIGPEAALVAGVVDALEEAGVPAFGPSAAAAELEGSKAFAKELMGEAGVPTASHVAPAQPRGGGRSSSPRLLPGGAEGRRAGGGQGRDHLRQRGRGARGGRRLLHRAALRRRRRWCWRSSSRARSSRCWRSATARTWCRWRPPRTTSGSSTATRGRTPAAWAATRRCRASAPPRSRRSSTPSTGRSSPRWRGAGSPFHGVLYAGLMIGADGPQGARVQRPLRRPRDAGGAAAAALRPARPLPRRARAGRPGRGGGRVRRGLGGDRWSWPRPATRSPPRRAT